MTWDTKFWLYVAALVLLAFGVAMARFATIVMAGWVGGFGFAAGLFLFWWAARTEDASE